jgi:hypothetical protein
MDSNGKIIQSSPDTFHPIIKRCEWKVLEDDGYISPNELVDFSFSLSCSSKMNSPKGMTLKMSPVKRIHCVEMDELVDIDAGKKQSHLLF